MKRESLQGLQKDEKDVLSFGLKVSGWLVPDVRRHLFLLVWVCGVPVHVQYVLHLLRMSAVPLEMATEGMGGELTTRMMETSNSPVPLSETSLRDLALDILFLQVADDCRVANHQVQNASLSTERWSEARSLMWSTANCGGKRIFVQDMPAKGEVLALLPSRAASPEELEAIYFTAVSQAQRFKEQHACPHIKPGAYGRIKDMAHLKNDEQNRPCVNRNTKDSETHVILVESDDDLHSVKKADIVVLSDDSSTSNSSGDGGVSCCRRQSLKRKRMSSEDVYEVVE